MNAMQSTRYRMSIKRGRAMYLNDVHGAPEFWIVLSVNRIYSDGSSSSSIDSYRLYDDE